MLFVKASSTTTCGDPIWTLSAPPEGPDKIKRRPSPAPVAVPARPASHDPAATDVHDEGSLGLGARVLAFSPMLQSTEVRAFQALQQTGQREYISG